MEVSHTSPVHLILPWLLEEDLVGSQDCCLLSGSSTGTIMLSHSTIQGFSTTIHSHPSGNVFCSSFLLSIHPSCPLWPLLSRSSSIYLFFSSSGSSPSPFSFPTFPSKIGLLSVPSFLPLSGPPGSEGWCRGMFSFSSELGTSCGQEGPLSHTSNWIKIILKRRGRERTFCNVTVM